MVANLKFIAISGSLRKKSYTRMALHIVLQTIRELGASTELIDLREFTLPFCKEYENDDELPEIVLEFRQKVKDADAIILGTPDYHGSFSGVLKNALDLIGKKQVGDKVMALIGVGAGEFGAVNALNELRLIGRSLHAYVIPSQVAIPKVSDQFTDDGQLLNEKILTRLQDVGTELCKYTVLMKPENFEEATAVIDKMQLSVFT